MKIAQPPNDPNQPRQNPVHAWLRLVIWLLPAGFALGSVVALNWLTSLFRIPSELGLCFCVVLNIAFIVGAGWYRAALLVQEEGNPDWNFGRIAAFFGLQLLLIPFLSVIILFAICASGNFRL